MAAVPAGLAAALQDRYRLDRRLGQGGMATVYLAHDLRHNRPVALKVLRPELAATLGSERFLREIEVTARLTHPNILPLHDSGLISSAGPGGQLDLPYYTMPYVEGESLRARLIREQQLPVDDALQIALEVAEALRYAHGHDLLHRDIKPENILLEAGHAVVADFGIATALSAARTSDESSGHMVVGTPAYMSPEQAAAGRALDGRSDLYALGCVLYEMLAGVPPFTGPTPESITRQHATARVPLVRAMRPSVPEQVEETLTRALAKMPADRFATAQGFAQALVRGAQPGPAARPWRRTAVLEIAVAALALPLLLLLLSRIGRHDLPANPAALGDALETPRIAVLYFDVPSSDSALAPFAEGLTEELIRELGGVKPFRVVSRNGVRQFRTRAVPFDSMVAALGVNTVIDGSVQRLGGRLQIRTELIDPRSNTIDTLSVAQPISDGQMPHLEIAQQLAARLRRQMGRSPLQRGEVAGIGNDRARELVLKARRAQDDAALLATTPHREDLRTAIETLRRADSLLVLAQVADSSGVRAAIHRGWVAYSRAQLLSGREQAAALAEGLQLAEGAVRRAPRSPLALELRGTLLWRQVGELQGGPADSVRLRQAEADLRDALDRDSTLARAWATLSFVLWFRGRTAEASLAAHRALEADTYLAYTDEVLGMLFFSDLMLGNFAQAGEWCRRGQVSYPGDWHFVECALTLMRHNADASPDPDSAWALVRRLDHLDPADKAQAEGRTYHTIYRRVVAATISARAGQHDLARAELARARRLAERDSTLHMDLAYDEAYLRLVLGERERAAALLREYFKARPMARDYISRDPLFRSLRFRD